MLQDIHNYTALGRLQENIFHVFNHFDKDTKSERTAINTREVMLKGYWPYMPPMGYRNLRPKHRACDHVYEITKEGRLLKRAFELKVEGALTNKQIADKLSLLGLDTSLKTS